jgi:hypothetical protein
MTQTKQQTAHDNLVEQKHLLQKNLMNMVFNNGSSLL